MMPVVPAESAKLLRLGEIDATAAPIDPLLRTSSRGHGTFLGGSGNDLAPPP
jgi:hypothetical protein